MPRILSQIQRFQGRKVLCSLIQAAEAAEAAGAGSGTGSGVASPL